MSRTYDVAVIGLGVMGTATLWQLAKRGLRVIGFEAHEIPHRLGSSHGRTRVIRQAYFEHPSYVPLLKRAYELWEEIGDNVLQVTGGLYFGPPGCELVDGSLESASIHDLDCERLNRDGVAARFPLLSPAPDTVGVYEAMGGFVRAERAITAMSEAAGRAGAVIRCQEPVIGWQKEGSGFGITTSAGRYTAQALVVCGGPWAGSLLGGLPLRVTRQVVAWVQFADMAPFRHDSCPVMAFQLPSGKFYYSIPFEPDSPGYKIAGHDLGTITTPEAVDRFVSEGDVAELLGVISDIFPGLNADVVASDVCLYTNSPDGHFILDRTGEGVVFATGFSGHGFKFAPVIGEVMAGMAVDGQSPLQVDFLGASRFD